jgi:hypothetical protein
MTAVVLPDWVEQALAGAPYNLDRRGLAELLSRLFGPISYRTIEGRDWVWRTHNGRAVTETRPAVEAEYARFIAAPEYRVIRTKKTAEAS